MTDLVKPAVAQTPATSAAGASLSIGASTSMVHRTLTELSEDEVRGIVERTRERHRWTIMPATISVYVLWQLANHAALIPPWARSSAILIYIAGFTLVALRSRRLLPQEAQAAGLGTEDAKALRNILRQVARVTPAKHAFALTKRQRERALEWTMNAIMERVQQKRRHDQVAAELTEATSSTSAKHST